MGNILTIVPSLLRDPQAFFESIQRGERVGSKALGLAVSSVLFLAIYGFVTGFSQSPLQALSSAVKMPLLFVATVAFCLPALYFFSLALLRTQLGMLQVTAVVLTGIGVTSFLLLGLSPVTFFFVLTSDNYPFFQLLAVAFVATSGCIGLYFLWKGMTLVDLTTEHTPGVFGRALLGIWMLLYAFVGAQMTWRLSPLIGDPTRTHFVFLQPSRDNFFVDVVHAFERATGIRELSRVSLDSMGTVIFGGFCLSVLCLLLFGIGALSGDKMRKKRRATTSISAADSGEHSQQDVLDDAALKARFTPDSSPAQ
jgi:hypothetical protein